DGEKHDTESRPTGQKQSGFTRATCAHDSNSSVNGAPEKERGPWQESNQKHRQVKPEGLDVPEFGGKVALEIVLDGENGQEIGIAAGAESIPRQGRREECGNRHGMKGAECVMAARGEEEPGGDGDATEEGCRTPGG